MLLTLWGTRHEIFGARPAWLDDPLLRETFSDEEIRLLENPAVAADAPAKWRAGVVPRGMAALKAAGVRFGLGDDAGATNGAQYFGYGSHIEMAAMVEAGLSPAEAITAATRNSAEILGARLGWAPWRGQECGLPGARRQPARRHRQHAPDRGRVPARRRRGPCDAPREVDGGSVTHRSEPRLAFAIVGGTVSELHANSDVSQLLVAWGEGDRSALDKLIPIVHRELRYLAQRLMRRERPGHSWQTADLVNKVYSAAGRPARRALAAPIPVLRGGGEPDATAAGGSRATTAIWKARRRSGVSPDSTTSR